VRIAPRVDVQCDAAVIAAEAFISTSSWGAAERRFEGQREVRRAVAVEVAATDERRRWKERCT